MRVIHKVKNLFKNELILHTFIVFIGTSVVGVFNLFYHLISVRILTPEDYGVFNTLISFVMVTSMSISPLGTTFTRFFTEYIAKKEYGVLRVVFKKLIVRLFGLAFLCLVFFIVFSSQLSRFLKVREIYIFICAGIIIVSLFTPLIISLFQSFQKFKTYSLISILSSLGKLILGVVLMLLGWKTLGGITGFLAGPVLIIFVSLFFVPAIFEKQMGKVILKDVSSVSLVPIYRYFFPVSIVMVSFTLLTTSDVILVKHFFTSLEAGYYSIAQMAGKIAFFLPSALAVVILPKSAKAHFTSGVSTGILYKSLFLAGTGCFLFTGFAFFSPDFLLNVLTGKSNPVSRQLVGLFALSMSFYALGWIVINYLLSTHNLKFVLPLAVIMILEAAVIYNCHPSLSMIVYILLVFSIISLFTAAFYVKFGKKKRI